jgi:hypothetical protein
MQMTRSTNRSLLLNILYIFTPSTFETWGVWSRLTFLLQNVRTKDGVYSAGAIYLELSHGVKHKAAWPETRVPSNYHRNRHNICKVAGIPGNPHANKISYCNDRRFYLAASFASFDPRLVVLTVMFLASKVLVLVGELEYYR